MPCPQAHSCRRSLPCHAAHGSFGSQPRGPEHGACAAGLTCCPEGNERGAPRVKVHQRVAQRVDVADRAVRGRSEQKGQPRVPPLSAAHTGKKGGNKGGLDGPGQLPPRTVPRDTSRSGEVRQARHRSRSWPSPSAAAAVVPSLRWCARREPGAMADLAASHRKRLGSLTPTNQPSARP